VAANSDGTTLSLYLKNLSDGDTSYFLLETLDISTSADPAISPGTGNGVDWDSGVFSIARGLHNGGHTDRFLGHLDNIRFSEGALAPEAFLYRAESSIPSIPSPPSATTISANRIDLSWEASATATDCSLKRSVDRGDPYTVVANPSAASHSDNSLNPGTTYYYVVSALNAGGESANSAEVAVTTWTLAQNWRFDNFGTIETTAETADDQDPDQDQVVNLLERAFGGNPNLAERNLHPAIDDNEPMLSIIYRKDKTATDLTFTVQESTDLSSPWVSASGSETLMSDDGTIQQMRFTRPAETDTRVFLRLKISDLE
jgi:hypothetical protein